MTFSDLKIPEYQCEGDLYNRLFSHPALKSIIKYRNHPSINNIRNSSQRFSSFYFSQVNTSTVLKEIRRLSAKKATQETNIPVIFERKCKIFCWTNMPSIQ